jgi:hypothetical protein
MIAWSIIVLNIVDELLYSAFKQHYLLFVLDQKTLPSYAPLLTEAQIISENIQ